MTKLGVELFYFLRSQVRPVRGGNLKPPVALVKGCSRSARWTSCASYHSSAWQRGLSGKFRLQTDADGGHIQYWTWYRCSWDLGSMDEVLLRPRRQLDTGLSSMHDRHISMGAGSPGISTHQFITLLVDDGTKGGRGIAGKEIDARCWIVVWSDGHEFGIVYNTLAIAMLGGRARCSYGVSDSLYRRFRSWEYEASELRQTVFIVIESSGTVLCDGLDCAWTNVKVPKLIQYTGTRGWSSEWCKAYNDGLFA